MRTLIVAAAICGLLLVGASTGHNSAPPAGGPDLAMAWMIKETGRQDLLNTILLFGFAHVLAALGTAALPLGGLLFRLSGWGFLAGVVMFSGGLTARLLLGEDGRVNALTMLVPVGGVAFMAGWILLAIAALVKRRES
jgi:uncharacterized membrane protein YgdD (TMEM256/DUF423 family)